jgi:hypothetical protein
MNASTHFKPMLLNPDHHIVYSSNKDANLKIILHPEEVKSSTSYDPHKVCSYNEHGKGLVKFEPPIIHNNELTDHRRWKLEHEGRKSYDDIMDHFERQRYFSATIVCDLLEQSLEGHVPYMFVCASNTNLTGYILIISAESEIRVPDYSEVIDNEWCPNHHHDKGGCVNIHEPHKRQFLCMFENNACMHIDKILAPSQTPSAVPTAVPTRSPTTRAPTVATLSPTTRAPTPPITAAPTTLSPTTAVPTTRAPTVATPAPTSPTIYVTATPPPP